MLNRIATAIGLFSIAGVISMLVLMIAWAIFNPVNDITNDSKLNIDQEQAIVIESLIKSNGGYVINGRYQTTNQYRIGDTLTIKYTIK